MEMPADAHARTVKEKRPKINAGMGASNPFGPRTLRKHGGLQASAAKWDNSQSFLDREPGDLGA